MREKTLKFSASQLKSWQSCALQTKYSYIDGLPSPTGSAAMFGSAVHEAIDRFHKGATEEQAVNIFKEELTKQEPDYWNRMTTLTGYLDNGERMIREYVASQQWADYDVVSSEFRFMVDIGEHQVSGIVDILQLPHNHSSLDIVDLKTGRRPILDTLHLDIQFSLYIYATYQKEFWCGHPDEPDKYSGFENGEELFEYFKNIPRRGFWYDLKKNEPINVGDRTMRDFARIYRLIEQVARAVEHEVFIPTINGDTCTWCDYQDICPVYFSKDDDATS